MSIAEKRVTGGAGRDRAVKIVIKDDYTDTEYKLSPEFTFTARCDMVYESGGRLVESKNGTAGSSGVNGISKGTKYVISASASKTAPARAPSPALRSKARSISATAPSEAATRTGWPDRGLRGEAGEERGQHGHLGK